MSGLTIGSSVNGPLTLTATSNPLTVTSTGSITTTTTGDAVSGGTGTAWQISNAGTISGTIGSSSAGIYLQGAGSTVQNSGSINGATAGIWLASGGTVTNSANASISASSNYGVYIGGAPGTVTNAGTITSAWYAVDFAFSSASNRLVVAPGAVFNGLVSGGNGTLELAGGTGSGSITGLNTGNFKNFAALSVDAGASWTLSGSNTIASVTDNGALTVTGALPTATYQIGAAGAGGTLEVASAPGAGSALNFLGSSKLVIDSASGFGTNVGTTSYAGPVLGGFASGDTVDIKNFSAANASSTYDPTSGLLQISNGTQTATLAFKTSTLASGTFVLASDGATGLNVTLSQATAPAAPTITSPASGSTDTTTTEPVISGTGVSGDTVTVSIDGAIVGTAAVSNSAWSYTPTNPLSNGSHSITATQAAPGGPNSVASAPDTFTVNVATAPAAPTITSPASGSTDTTTTEPVISGTGISGDTVTVSIDGAIVGTAAVSNSAWSYTPTNPLSNGSHSITATQAAPGGPNSVASAPDTFTVSVSTTGLTIGSSVNGPLTLTATSNPLTVTSTGSITTTTTGDAVSGGTGTAWQISNAGTISGTVGSSSAGIYLQGAGSTVQNSGSINGATAGIWLASGGTVTNSANASISASSNYGVYIGGAPGTVTNAGTITSAWYAVDFAFSSASNRLVVAPGAVFNGLVSGGNGTLELAGGTGSGSITGLNTGNFKNFAALSVDAGATWTLSGSNTIASVTDNGSLTVTGNLPTATYQIGAAGAGGTLEVASAPGAGSALNFLGSSKLVIDSASGFGTNVGTTSYAGPVLGGFASGDTVDLKNFSAANASSSYDPTSGLLQISNGTQTATLAFKTSTLASGTFVLASDGGSGLNVTLSQATAPAAPTITSPASGSTDTTTSEPVISGTGVSGDTVTVSIDGAIVGTAAVSNSAWSYTPTNPLSNGSHSITATQAAPGGPNSVASAPDTFTVNVATAPAAPTITSPASGSTDTTTSEPVISGTGVSGDTVTVSIDGAIVGTAAVSNSAWSYTPTNPLSNGSHSITATQAAAGGPSSAASAPDTFTVNVSSGGLTIGSAVNGPLTLSAANNPLTISSSGSVTATASGADGIDGGSGTAWSINNAGTVASSQHYGISLHGAGSSILNSGSISGSSSSGNYGVDLEAGGSVTNTSTGSISGGEDAIFAYGAPATITNSGHITSSFDDGIGLFGGGSVTNNAGGVIQAPTSGGYGPAGIYIPSGTASVVNHGSISGQYGVYLGVAGTVENAGSISGTSYAVDFAATSSANRLIVDPGATFTGGVNGHGGVLELAAGSGSIGQIGASAFSGFNALSVDANATWTLTGSNTMAGVTANGGLAVAGSLKVTGSVDPASTGHFDLQSGGVLEVAADTAAHSQIDFVGASKLIIDDASHFGTGIGTSSYAGPLLENFDGSDSIDLHAFSATAGGLAYDPTTGLLQVTNGSNQVATLDFQNPTLATGSFHLASDGSGGMLITA